MTRKKPFPVRLSLLGIWLFFVLAFLGSGIAWGAGEKKDCTAIGDLDDVLKKLRVPDARVISIEDSPVKGICEAIVEVAGQTKILYVDVDKKYLIAGSFLDLSDLSNKTKETIEKFENKRRVDIGKIPLANFLVLGAEGAPKKVVVFTDPDCPYCAQLHKTMKDIVSKRKDIAFYIKFLPLEFHKDAYWKAKSIVCSRSIQMLEDNFDHKEIPKKDCSTDEIEKSVRLAQSLGIGGTPSLILPDGRLKAGALPEVELLDLIDGKK